MTLLANEKNNTVALLESMLKWTADERPTARQCLGSVWIRLESPVDEMSDEEVHNELIDYELQTPQDAIQSTPARKHQRSSNAPQQSRQKQLRAAPSMPLQQQNLQQSEVQPSNEPNPPEIGVADNDDNTLITSQAGKSTETAEISSKT